MAVWWEALLVDNFDLVTAMVGAESRGRLSPEEQKDAVQLALTKLTWNMVRTFNGTSMGEWVKATRTLVTHACIDTQRREQRHNRRKVSLDAMREAGEDGPGGYDAAMAKAALEQQRLDDDRESDEELAAYGQEFLDWASPQLSKRLRSVLELDRKGTSVEQMAAILDVSDAVIYTTRRRLKKELEKLMEAYRS